MKNKPTADPTEPRSSAARVNRCLALLRSHGLVRKVPHSHRYHLTPKGRTVMTAHQADTAKATELAA